MQPIFIAKKFIISKHDPWWKIGLKIVFYCFILTILLVVGVFAYYAKDLPTPGKIARRPVAESSKIFDRTGEHLLYEIHGEEKRTIIDFKEMPSNIKYATISLEDQDFYSHHGIKLTSIIRSIFKDILHRGTAQGGSTITQQFVKNSVLTGEKTFTRKIKEAILSIELEQKFSKDEILGMYLNEIPYGSNAYGVEAATRTFFGKPARELTLDEAAMIAALPQASSYYSPYGSHLDALKGRQEFALNRMADLGYITKEQAEDAKAVDVFEKLAFNIDSIYAPHMVMYVKEYLEINYGQELVEKGGLRVYTTLDWDKQQVAERVIREGVDKNKNYRASNAALVAMDPKTGQILAMVGSKDYFDKSIDGQVNVATRDRQPGSSFKPYVYLTGFMKGYTPETMLFDVETNFGTESGKDYKPQNYDGKFRGPIQAKFALSGSLNIPAVEMLYLAGVKNSIETAKKMGITGLNQPDRYGLSLVLGGGEIKLVDHVGAFGVLANNGIKNNKTAILRIQDSKGEILEEYQPSQERVIEEKYVAMLDHILSTNDYRSAIFGSNSPLRFDDRPVAAKTGTTNEFRDGWTIGYTPSLVAGVWAGNNDNSPMAAGADGVNVAAPIWRAFLNEVLKNYNIEQFPKYEKEETGKPILDGEIGLKKEVRVCEIPGEDDKYCLAEDFCDDKTRDFVEGHTILYYVNKDDPRGEYPKNPEKDPQFKSWEKALKEWYGKNDKKYILDEIPDKKCNKDDFEKNFPSISLSVPGSVNTNQLEISASADTPMGMDKVEFYINGEKIYSSGKKPFEKKYEIPVDRNGTTLEVKAKITDEEGNEATDTESVSVAF
jgi:1A family penicillin-binding protein